jgi:hypothetical protein
VCLDETEAGQEYIVMMITITLVITRFQSED